MISEICTTPFSGTTTRSPSGLKSISDRDASILKAYIKNFCDALGHSQTIATYALGNGDQGHFYLPDTV